MVSEQGGLAGEPLETAMQSLPSYQLAGYGGGAQAPRMIAIEHGEGLQMALITSKGLLTALKTSLDDGIKAMVQEEMSKRKNDVLVQFEEWAQQKQEELSAQIKIVEAVPRQHNLVRSLHLQLNELNDKLDSVDQCRATLGEEVRRLEHVAELSNLGASALLYDIFKAQGFIDTQAEEAPDQPLDEEFLRKWMVPRQQDEHGHATTQQDSNSSQKDQSNAQRQAELVLVSSEVRRTRGRSPTRRRSRSASPRRHDPEERFARDRSPARIGRPHDHNNYAPTLSPRQQHRRRRGPSYEPQDPFQLAERDFRARVEDLQTAQCDFDWHWGGINQAKNESPSEAGRRLFKANNRLTRNLSEAWDRFREARHHCNELGVEVPYDQQTSAFPTKPDDGEEKFRTWMLPFIGPEKQPWVEQWVEAVEEERDSVSSQKRREKVAARAPETDEWDAGSDINAWDSMSTVAEGRERHRIKSHQAVQEIQREEAGEQRQKVTASKRKRVVEQSGDGGRRAAKARKRA